MSRVLVTGGNGFIGRHATRFLSESGWDVHLASRSNIPAIDGIEQHQVDLLDPQACQQIVTKIAPSHLLHLAWYTKHGEFWSSAENMRWVAASLHLLHCFRKGGGKRAVMAGSCAEYKWRAGACHETHTPLEPHTYYGTSKLALQQVGQGYAERSGMEFLWGRIFHAYGPGEDRARLVPDLMHKLLAGEVAPCRAANHVRDFTHAADLGALFAKLVEHDLTGALNLGSGIKVSLGEVAETIARLCDREDLLELQQKPDTDGQPETLVPDLERLRSHVDWTPSKDLESGLAEIVGRAKKAMQGNDNVRG